MSLWEALRGWPRAWPRAEMAALLLPQMAVLEIQTNGDTRVSEEAIMRARHSLDDPNMRVSAAGRAPGTEPPGCSLTHRGVGHPCWGVNPPISVRSLGWCPERRSQPRIPVCSGLHQCWARGIRTATYCNPTGSRIRWPSGRGDSPHAGLVEMRGWSSALFASATSSRAECAHTLRADVANGKQLSADRGALRSWARAA